MSEDRESLAVPSGTLALEVIVDVEVGTASEKSAAVFMEIVNGMM
jgi:hypothetical protein